MVTNWITQLRKGLAELAVLHVLGQGESYGYEILQRLAAMPHLGVGESTVYPLLGRLAEAGFVEVRSVASATGPPRRYYRLTPNGKLRLKMLDSCWRDVVRAMATFDQSNTGGDCQPPDNSRSNGNESKR